MTPSTITLDDTRIAHAQLTAARLSCAPGSERHTELGKMIAVLEGAMARIEALESARIDAMADRLKPEKESERVIVLKLQDAHARRRQLTQALRKCEPGTERHEQLQAQLRTVEQTIKTLTDRLDAAAQPHPAGEGQR